MATDVLVPDLGDFKDVEVIDVLVKPGDKIDVETPLLTLETEKATMDVPSSAAGVVKSVAVKKGDRVSKGSLVLTVEATGAAAAAPADDKAFTETLVRGIPPVPPPPAKPSTPSTTPAAVKATGEPGNYDFDVVVLGAGPGGYTAAFRAA